MLPEVTARLDADVEPFVRAWNRAADAAVRNAAQIRAAIESLPEVTRIRVEVDIDNDRLRGLGGELDRLTRNARAAGDAMRDFGNQARQSGEGVRELGESSRRASGDVNSLGERARRAGGSLGGFGGRMKMAGAGGKVMAAAVALVASVLPAVAAAALAAGAALQGLVVAGAVVAGGWKGISQAGEKLKATLGGLQKQLESVFRSGLSKEFQQLGQAIAGLDGPLKGIARSIVGVVKEFTGWIRSAEGMSQIETMLGGVDNMVKSLGPGAKAMAQAFTEFGSAAAPAMDDIGKAISFVFEKLTEVIQKGKETGQLEKAFEAGAKAIEAFGEILAGVVDILIEMAGAGGEEAAEALKSIGKAMQDSAPYIGVWFKQMAQVAMIVAKVVEWFAKLLKATEPLARKVQELGDRFTKLFTNDEAAKKFGAAVAVAFELIKKTIKKGVDDAVKNVKKWWEDTKKETKKGVDDAIKNVKKWWDDTKKEVKKGVEEAIKNVKKWWDDTKKEVKKGVDDALKAIKKWASDLVKDIKKGIADFVKEVQTWWDDTVEAVEEGVADAVAAIAKLPEKAMDALSDWVSDMKDAGKDAVEGLADGMESAVGNLVGVAKGIAQKAMNAIKSTLGIRSPSTVFRDEVGKMIPAGIADGIIANSGLVTDAMRRAGLASVAAGGAAFGGASLGRGGRAGQQVFTLQVLGGADSAAGTFISHLARTGKLKIKASAVVR